MASYSYTFNSGDGVTPTRLNAARTVSDIVNADIKSDAAIALSKLTNATGFGLIGKTANSIGSYEEIPAAGDGSVLRRSGASVGFGQIVDAGIASNAAIAGTKIAPNFGTQNVVTTGTLSSGAMTAPTLTLNTGSTPLLISNASEPYVEVRDTTATTRAFMQALNGLGGIGTISNHPFRINTNNTERMRIDASGNVGIGTSTPAYLLDANGTVNTSDAYRVDGTQVVSNRRTGWAAPTGTATRTAFATSTVTTAQLAERVKALIDDLTTHGLIGS